MTKLDRIKVQAQVAIATTGAWDDRREHDNSNYLAAIHPQIILAMIDVIEEAIKIGNDDFEDMENFNAALSKLDQMK